MTSYSFQLHAVGGALAQEAGNAHHSWKRRDALLVVVRTREGLRGVGEAAPLPGYSNESLAACQSALDSLQLPEGELSLAYIRQRVGSIAEALPSARFAIETALLDLLAQVRGLSVAAILAEARAVGPRACGELLRCGLLDSRDPIGSAQHLALRGLRCAKLKVGRDWSRELPTIRGLRAQLPSLRLRLDVNGAWSVAEAQARLLELAELDIEFVEQPVTPANMGAIKVSPVPLAADESLRSAETRNLLESLLADRSLVALVLKPSILGGALACIDLADWGASRQVEAIVSHCFEGPTATAAIAELALAIHSGFAAGLDTHAGLSVYPGVQVPQLAALDIRSHAPGLGVQAL